MNHSKVKVPCCAGRTLSISARQWCSNVGRACFQIAVSRICKMYTNSKRAQRRISGEPVSNTSAHPAAVRDMFLSAFTGCYVRP